MRFFADCEDLRLEVFDQGSMFEFRVLDKRDGAVLWAGAAPTLDSAKNSAAFEAQTFATNPQLSPSALWFVEE